jgi:uncharacterized membrane protein
MKTIVTIIMLAFAMSVSAADAPKKATDKKAAVKKEKCVPSKEVVCQDSLKGKTRPTPKKKTETPK